MYQTWIDTLGLEPHPEGGYYRRTYCATVADKTRPLSSAIYYLLPAQQISMLHRIQSDEMWHFYAGGSLQIDLITPSGESRSLYLGLAVADGEQPQQLVPAGCWFGAQVVRGDYVLAGCTVTPAFDFAEFELGQRAELLVMYPQYIEIIIKLTKELT